MKRILEYRNAFFLFPIFLIMIIEMTCRGILHIPVSFTDELARAVYTVMVFLGASLGLRDRSHITVDLMINVVPRKAKRILRIIAAIAMIPFIIIMTIGSFENVKRYWTSVVSTADWLKVGHLYLAVAISGILSIFYIILNLFDDITNRTKTTEAGDIVQ